MTEADDRIKRAREAAGLVEQAIAEQAESDEKSSVSDCEFDYAVALDEAAADLFAAVDERDALRARLEIDPRHGYDGISCREETIRLLDERIAKLEQDRSAALEKYQEGKDSKKENLRIEDKEARQILRKALVDMVGSDDAEELDNMASYLKISKDPSAQEKELMFRAIEALNKTRE